MSDPVVYRSNVRIERVRGPLRRAYVPQETEPIFFGVHSLWRALDEYRAHYHQERPHQGIGNELITKASAIDSHGEVIESERLGGLLRSYRRAA